MTSTGTTTGMNAGTSERRLDRLRRFAVALVLLPLASACASDKSSWVGGCHADDSQSQLVCETDPSAVAVASPDTAAPDAATPDTAAPDTAAPDTAAPDTAAPDTAAPDTAAPDTTAAAADTTVVAADGAAYLGLRTYYDEAFSAIEPELAMPDLRTFCAEAASIDGQFASDVGAATWPDNAQGPIGALVAATSSRQQIEQSCADAPDPDAAMTIWNAQATMDAHQAALGADAAVRACLDLPPAGA